MCVIVRLWVWLLAAALWIVGGCGIERVQSVVITPSDSVSGTAEAVRIGQQVVSWNVLCSRPGVCSVYSATSAESACPRPDAIAFTVLDEQLKSKPFTQSGKEVLYEDRPRILNQESGSGKVATPHTECGLVSVDFYFRAAAYAQEGNASLLRDEKLWAVLNVPKEGAQEVSVTMPHPVNVGWATNGGTLLTLWVSGFRLP